MRRDRKYLTNSLDHTVEASYHSAYGGLDSLHSDPEMRTEQGDRDGT